MSENPEGVKRLTADDPVEAETLNQLRELQEARMQVAESLLDLEQERIQILAAAKRIDDQRNRVFQAILVDRGLSPNTRAEIDARSGKLILALQNEPEPPT